MKRRKRGHPEQNVIDATIAATRTCLLWFRVHSGVIDLGFRKVVFGKKGRVDYFAIRIPDGKFVAVEFKAPGKKSNATPQQLDCLEAVRRAGGIAVLADCPQDVIDAIAN